ncbi:energy-coupling factor ABC transporter ATP-binding protein [Oleidesulfovibrio sp.]|uniref:energy-coupling factor ABC transporter ATP-binding protein n=1 Tax=Oleidesulfovibrio sp. TaxID=2909707 RepID=UPI003A8A9B20
MITISSVSFTYPGAAEAVLRDVTLRVERGTLLCLCGANGSGKSTLLSLLAGLFAPSGGSLSVGSVQGKGQERELRRQAALMLQDADLQIIGSTVEEDLMLTAGHGEEAYTRAYAMAQRFDLAKHWQSPVQILSYGQKRKLCLAAATLREPQLLLLDEPFSGLDYPAMMELREVLRANARAGLTQIVSVHDVEPVIDLATAGAVLHKGGLAVSGEPARILERAHEFGLRVPCSWRHGHGIQPWE